jgi:hypothetical protein
VPPRRNVSLNVIILAVTFFFELPKRECRISVLGERQRRMPSAGFTTFPQASFSVFLNRT